jgi:hypothetical protein
LVHSENSTKISNLLKYFEDKSKEADVSTHPEILSPRSKQQIRKERGATTPRGNKKPLSPRDGSTLPTNSNAPPTNRHLQSDRRSTSVPNLQNLIQQARTFGSLSQAKSTNQNIDTSNKLSNQATDSQSTVSITTTTTTTTQSPTNLNTTQTQPHQNSLPSSTNTQNKTITSGLNTTQRPTIEKISKSETKESISDATLSTKTSSTTTDRLRFDFQ